MPKTADPRGVNSVEVGARVLRSLAQANGPLTLGAVASECAMLPGKAHRYLRSLVAAGLVVREPATRLYDLGPFAYMLGAAALQRYDVVRAASKHLDELRAACGESASLMIWGDSRGVVVRSEDSGHDVSIVLRVGAPVRLLTSAAGRIFGAFLPSIVTGPVLDTEFAERPMLGGKRISRAAYASILGDVRERGTCVVHDGPVAGAGAIAAPLFGPEGRLLAVVSVVGRSATLDVTRGGPVERALLAFCRRVESAPS